MMGQAREPGDKKPPTGFPLAALERQAVHRDAVDWAIATHVHLDHAGGVGALLQELPNARLVVHPRATSKR